MTLEEKARNEAIDILRKAYHASNFNATARHAMSYVKDRRLYTWQKNKAVTQTKQDSR